MRPLGSLGKKQLQGALVLLTAAVVVTTVPMAMGPVRPLFYSSPPCFTEQTAASTALQIDVAGDGGGIYFFEGTVTLGEVITAVAPTKAKLFEGDILNLVLSHGDGLVIRFKPPSVRPAPMANHRRAALGIPMDINTVTMDDLVMIPGVGPATAAAILDLREERGGFSSVEELGEIRGIGVKRFAELERHLVLDREKGW